MTGKNSEVFLATFNQLEKHFKNKFFRGSWKSFKQMLKEGSRNNPIIWQFKEELFEFTDLRNAIVHNRNHNYQVIAEPHDFVVERFSYITKEIMNPVKINTFNKKVFTCLLNDPLAKALQHMKNNHISQIPILDNNLMICEILNTSTIAYWFSNKNNTTEVSISEILQSKEYHNNYEIIKANTTVYDAANLFKESYKKDPKNKYYDAILITQNGNANEKIKGIIVLTDIAEYL